MSKKIIAVTTCFFIFSSLLFAQTKEFYLVPKIGLLNGNNHVNEMIGLSTGLKSNDWFYGIGASIDYYKFRSVPFYAEVKRTFGKKKITPFLYANGGINIDWVLANQHKYYNNWGWGTQLTNSTFSNGHFLEIGSGVDIKNKKGKGFILSVGYSSKSLSESWVERIWDPTKNEMINSPRQSRYNLNRLALTVGYRIF